MNWTRRQHEAFWNYRTRLEYVLLLKATPITNGEEARQRWDRLTWAQTQFREAQKELDASITDAFDADRAAAASKVPPTPWPGASPNKRNDDECTCAADATALCPIHHGYAR